MKFEVEAINISEKKGVQKTPVEYADFVENHGIKNDAHAGKWHRQVSFLAGESVDVMRNKAGDFKIKHGDFGENIVTRGVAWAKIPVGTKMTIGEVALEVTQIGKECHTGCAIYQAAGDCIMPREGIFAKVLKGGRIHVGDSGNYNIGPGVEG